MAFDLLSAKGCPVNRQRFTWKDLVQKPVSKLNGDAFTRLRILVMSGVEFESVLLLHHLSRSNRELRPIAATIRSVDLHQQTLVNGLLPPDLSPLEMSVAYEQAEVELAATLAQREPDVEAVRVYREGLLENFDHLYRFAALLDRLEGKDANNILQNLTAIGPGRPTSQSHRHPTENVVAAPIGSKVKLATELHARTSISLTQRTLSHYLNVGPSFADPVARQLYAEITSAEERHLTLYASLLNPDKTPLELWLLHEANEVFNYWSCVESEQDPRIKAIWERFLDYELGQLNEVCRLFTNIERRDPIEVISEKLERPLEFIHHRDFIRDLIENELGSVRDDDMGRDRARDYRDDMNSEGSPSEGVAQGYRWVPGGELNREIHRTRQGEHS